MAEQQLSVRDKRIHDVQERMRKAQAEAAPRVRVVPRDDNIRKYIKHQPSQIAFPESGSVEWPLDAFTQRRIEDGDVTVEGQPQQEPEPQQKESRGSADAKG
jgi:hypothetical protein